MISQDVSRKVRQNLILILVGLTLYGLFGVGSMSLAVGDFWTKKADMQDSRVFFATCAVGGKIYAIGGETDWNANCRLLSTVEKYDPGTNTWTKVADMPDVNWCHSASAVGGKIYVIGGNAQKGVINQPVLEYDPAEDKWTTKGFPPKVLSAHCSAVVNGKTYVFGGLDVVGNAHNSVFEYDAAKDKWAQKTNMPTARCLASASVVDGKIYVISGTDMWLGAMPGAEKFRTLSSVKVYDPAKDTWEVKADMPTVRCGIATSAVNGKIYAIGGGVKNVFVTLTLVEQYDPMTDTWKRMADMLTPRNDFLSACEVNGRVYAIGGCEVGTWNGFSTVEEYTPEETKGKSVSPRNKLATTWGGIKSN